MPQSSLSLHHVFQPMGCHLYHFCNETAQLDKTATEFGLGKVKCTMTTPNYRFGRIHLKDMNFLLSVKK